VTKNEDFLASNWGRKDEIPEWSAERFLSWRRASFDWFSKERLELCHGEAFGRDNFNGATPKLVAVLVPF
jgi:hypothetical protein